jgi:TatD DNase family protein
VIDTHVHIHDQRFDDDRAAVVARAREAGLSHMISVGCDLADSARALDVARDYRIYSSVGIHPHEAKDAPVDIELVFEPFLHDRRVVAIGETGLDYYYDHSPRDVQARVMRAQVRLARDTGFPLIFHQRDAYDDFLAILNEEWVTGMKGVIHCFTGDAAAARTYVDDFGLLLGIGGVVTFKTAEPLRAAVAEVGLDSIVLETDCPYLTPVPHRGERNEPAYVTYAASKIAEILGCTVDEVSVKTDANALALFPLHS